MKGETNVNMEYQLRTISEVARTGAMRKGTIRKLVASGEIPSVQVGNRRLINYPKFLKKYGLEP